MGYKLDLHTHSYGSSDGGLKQSDYRYFLQNKLLDFIAITDHNSIEAAQAIKLGLEDLGRNIIVGEEIMTTKGEIIGLFLTQKIEPGMSPLDTVKAIKGQGGLIYIPHPFETVRSGMQAPEMNAIAADIDIVEICNGRAIFQNRSKTAMLWARQNSKPGAASSDAHGRFGWGVTYSKVDHAPDHENLARILAAATYSTRTVGWGILYPKFNRLRKKFYYGTV